MWRSLKINWWKMDQHVILILISPSWLPCSGDILHMLGDCVCEGNTSIVHWVSFLTRKLRWHCVTGISLEIRKASIFQNQFNFVSSGDLLILPEAWFSQLELGDAISYLLGLSSDLQEDICKVHGIVIGTHQNSNNCRLNQTCSLIVHMSLDLK